MLCRASVAFPLQHTFVDADHCGDPTRYLIRANMTKFVAFLSESVELRACPFRVIRTTKNRDLRPLSDYVTIAVDVPGAGERTYKYAEGCWNLALTDKGRLLPLDIQLLEIERSCSKGCGAVHWREIVTPRDLRQRDVQICFRSFSSAHTISCVPAGTVSRPQKTSAHR